MMMDYIVVQVAEDGTWFDDPVSVIGLTEARHIARALPPVRGYEHLIFSLEYVETVEPDKTAECVHEWIDIRNSAVQSGSMCSKCGALRAENFDQ